eukprot:2702670-Amphidinium_carterae.2
MGRQHWHHSLLPSLKCGRRTAPSRCCRCRSTVVGFPYLCWKAGGVNARGRLIASLPWLAGWPYINRTALASADPLFPELTAVIIPMMMGALHVDTSE